MREENKIIGANCLITSIISIVVIALIVIAIVLGVKACNKVKEKGAKNIIEEIWEGEKDGNKNKD